MGTSREWTDYYYYGGTRPKSDMLGWKREGARYSKTLGGTYEYTIIRCVSPEDNGYGPAGTVTWQVEVNGEWTGNDPFPTLRAAKEWAVKDAL